MEEKTVRKLHPVLQILLIAVITLGIRLLYSWIINPYLLQIVREALPLYYVLNFIVGVLVPFLAALLCFRVIEKQSIPVWVLLVIALGLQLVLGYGSTVMSIYVGRFRGDLALANWSRVNMVINPVVTAGMFTLIVDVLTAPKKEAVVNDEKMRISLVAHVLLLLFVGGIWRLIWIYRATRYLNCVPGETYRNPGTKLLLCMFVPFYSLYWTYKSAQRIDVLAESRDVRSDLAVVCLILDIFIPLIPPILMQDKINKILDTL